MNSYGGFPKKIYVLSLFCIQKALFRNINFILSSGRKSDRLFRQKKFKKISVEYILRLTVVYINSFYCKIVYFST